jgi:hypothetical protein
MLNGVDEDAFAAYLASLHRTLKFTVDAQFFDQAFDASMTIVNVKRDLAESLDLPRMKLSINGKIVPNATLVGDLPDAVIVVQSLAIETVDEIKQRISAETGTIPDYLTIEVNGREVTVGDVSDEYEVRLSVPIRDSSRHTFTIVASVGDTVKVVMDDLSRSYRPGFALFSAGRAVEADAALAGLAFPLELRHPMEIHFLINGAQQRTFTFFEDSTVDSAISALADAFPGSGPVFLSAGGSALPPGTPLSRLHGVLVDATFSPEFSTELILRYAGDVVTISVAPGRTFKNVREWFAAVAGIDLRLLRIECSGTAVSDKDPPSAYAGRIIDALVESPPSVADKRKVTFQWGFDKISKRIDTNETIGRVRAELAKEFGTGRVGLSVDGRPIADDAVIGAGKELIIKVDASGIVLQVRMPDGRQYALRPQFPFTTVGTLEANTEEWRDFEFWQNGARIDRNTQILKLKSRVIELRPRP